MNSEISDTMSCSLITDEVLRPDDTEREDDNETERPDVRCAKLCNLTVKIAHPNLVISLFDVKRQYHYIGIGKLLPHQLGQGSEEDCC